MTDNEIIKALECCIAVVTECNEDCPYYNYDDCERKIWTDCLDLINRTKIESKRYRGKCALQKKELTRLYDEINHQKAEIERLQKLLDDKCDKCISRNRSEAVEKFISKHREMMMAFCDEDDQISLKVCEYDTNTNLLL